VNSAPWKILAQDEIGDAADRIGAVYRRGAFGQHFDPLDHALRYQVEVGIGHALAIDEHQRAVDAQAPQRDACRAIAAFKQGAGDAATVAVVLGIGRVTGNAGELLQYIAQGGLAGTGDVAAIQRHHRAGRLDVDASDQRTGDDHTFQVFCLFLGLAGCGLIRSRGIGRCRILCLDGAHCSENTYCQGQPYGQ
jgi:hypothetical protein